MRKITLSIFASLTMMAESINLDKVEVNEASINDESSFIIEKEGFLHSAPMQKQITTKQALEMAGTNGDPLKALKSFAGVVSSNNDNASELYIHGSKPRETSFSINHLRVGYLFHLGGLHSVVSPNMISQIDAYLGGFDVSYQAMGAVIDVTPKYPNGSNNGNIHLGMYDADFSYDGKIGENTNFFIGARRSYFDLIATKIMDELDSDDEDKSKKTTFTLFPQFYDAQFMLTHTMGNHIFSLESIMANDKMKLFDTMQKDKDPKAVGKINTDVKFNTIGARWIYDGDNFVSNTLFYRKYYKENLELFNDNYFVDTSTTDIGLYHESVFELKNHKPMVGFEIINTKAPIKAKIVAPDFEDFEGLVSTKDVISLNKTFNAKTYTLFAQDIWDIKQNQHFRYGLRAWESDFQKFGSGVDPRVAFVYDYSDDFTVSAAVGKYSQLPQELFVIDGFGNPKIDTYEFANHYTLSFQKKFSDNSSLVVEPYFKTFENLAIDDEELNYKAVGEGEAYGVDVTYTKKINDFNIIAAYTFVKAKRQIYSNDKKQYRFQGDIPNTLQVSTNYKFDNGWRVSSFLKYNDGSTYTPIVSTKDYQVDGKTYKAPIYGEPYSARLPSNFDLDIQVGKTIKYAKGQSLEFSLEFMNINALLRENVAGIEYNDDFEKDGEYHQMGFLPAFHINYKF